ncbi:MAG: hypothetical protein ACE37F_10240 [Nannocystaceae bacterium]|nr:hypothetical protein [bacterium]
MSDEEDIRDSRKDRNRFSRLGDQLSGLLDPEAALRRGHGLVTGVTATTKNEITRIVGAEVRNFLDKMDIADLAQQIVAGLQVDVQMTVKFSRDDEGNTQPEITRSEASVSTSEDVDEAGARDDDVPSDESDPPTP